MKLILLTLSLASAPAPAQEDNLAKQVANPVADLISFPIHSNFDFDVGPRNGWRNTTNVQPVVSFGLTTNWKVISRTIVPIIYPIIYQNDAVGRSGEQFGLSDTLQSLFLSPRSRCRPASAT